MNVWVENPGDTGSVVWGCDHCHHGAWCPNATTATAEAKEHARKHGIYTLKILRPGHTPGPKPDPERDAHILNLRNTGLSLRTIGTIVGITHVAVIKALRRARRTA